MTDHMLEADWHASTGWANPTIKPYGAFQLYPSALCLHYGLEVKKNLKYK